MPLSVWGAFEVCICHYRSNRNMCQVAFAQISPTCKAMSANNGWFVHEGLHRMYIPAAWVLHNAFLSRILEIARSVMGQPDMVPHTASQIQKVALSDNCAPGIGLRSKPQFRPSETTTLDDRLAAFSVRKNLHERLCRLRRRLQS